MPRKKPVAIEAIVEQAIAKLRHDIDSVVINAFKEGLQNGKAKTTRRRRSRKATRSKSAVSGSK